MRIDQQTIWQNEMEEFPRVGLPHLFYEPRKPVMSGSTLIQNAAEEVHSDAIIISHDVQVQVQIQLANCNIIPDLIVPTIRRRIGDEEDGPFPRKKRHKYSNLNKWKNTKQ